MKLTFYKTLEWLAWRLERVFDKLDNMARWMWARSNFYANRATEKRERLEK